MVSYGRARATNPKEDPEMMKRVIALVLCFVMVLPCLVSCSKSDEDKGAYIRMYLSEPIYDFDPLTAFNDADKLQIIDLLFDGLFEADENGKPQKALVDKYEYTADKKEDYYVLKLELNETHWSDGSPLTSQHAQYAFRRLFAADVSHPATAMLYDIKNARKIAAGEAGYSVDDLKVSAPDSHTLEIEFEYDIDVDNFLQVLCSPALYPMRDDIVEFNIDWAKSTTELYCSGPFVVRSMAYNEKDGFILERNSYYYRERTAEKSDAIDKYVTPFRLICDFTIPVEEQIANFDSREVGSLYYLGNIPVAGRNLAAFQKLLKKGDLVDSASTHVYYMNQNAEIGGTKLFANAAVRQALSLALDREAIAEALVFAEAADALVPGSVLYRPDRKAEFRRKADEIISTSAGMDAAKQKLSEAGINAASYSFSITVPAYKTNFVLAAEMAQTAWKELGFNVTLNKLDVVERTTMVEGKEQPTGIFDDPYKTALDEGTFEVIALDLVSTSVDAFGYLAPFAAAFSGGAMKYSYSEQDGYKYETTAHITGYNDADYNAKIEEAFNEKKESKRAKLLVEAEQMLLEDMPVIPVVYNKTFSLSSKKLGKIDSGFFSVADFTEAKLSGYWKIAQAEGLIVEYGKE